MRWDPAGFAERELAERRELGFPPAVTMASVTGAAAHVRELVEQVELAGLRHALEGVDDARFAAEFHTGERTALRDVVKEVGGTPEQRDKPGHSPVLAPSGGGEELDG